MHSVEYSTHTRDATDTGMSLDLRKETYFATMLLGIKNYFCEQNYEKCILRTTRFQKGVTCIMRLDDFLGM